MSVSRADVLHVARLARLHLNDEDVVQFTDQLNAILAHVAELNAVDTSSVEAIGTVAEWPAPLRADEPGADPLAFPAARLSAHGEAGFFTVPRLAAMDAGSA